MKRKLTGGQTNVSLPIFVQDTSSTTGGGLSGVTHASSGLVIEYRRRGQSTWTTSTPVTKTLGTFIAWGIVADGSLAGAYELDLPDAAFASGARWVVIRVRGVANMLPVLIEIELDAVDYQDATAFGLSRIDQTIGSRSTQTSVDTLAGYIDTEIAAIKAKTDNLPAIPAAQSDCLNAAGIRSAVGLASANLDTLLSMITGYIDTEIAAIKAKTDNLPLDPADASEIATSFATLATLLNTLTSYVDTEVAAIKAKTDNLPSAPAAVSDIPTAATIATSVGNLQVLTRLDSMIESNGGAQFRFDTIALELAPSGGGGGGATDWTIDERTAIRAILGIPGSGTAPADPTVGILDTIRDNVGILAGYVDTEVAAIKLKTDLIPAEPASRTNITSATGITVSALAANVITEASIADGAINRATFGADTGLQNIRSGTAQAGASTSITLDAGASSTNNFYNNAIIYITGGTGVGQSRFCTAYNGTTKVATVAAWSTNPNATSTFAILPFDSIPGASAPTAAAVADAVWDEVLSGHLSAGSTGEKLHSGTTVIVTPSVGLGVDVTTRELVLPIDADYTIVRVVLDANGTQVTLPTDCTFVLTDANEVVIAELTPAINGAAYTVVIPRNLTTQQRTINFALRDPPSNVALDYGTIQFTYAATA